MAIVQSQYKHPVYLFVLLSVAVKDICNKVKLSIRTTQIDGEALQ